MGNVYVLFHTSFTPTSVVSDNTIDQLCPKEPTLHAEIEGYFVWNGPRSDGGKGVEGEDIVPSDRVKWSIY